MLKDTNLPKSKKLNELASCQIRYQPCAEKMPKKCEKCADRFLCLTQRFEAKDVTFSGQLFSVPNTPEGKEFLGMARKYLNRDRFYLKSRGRARNRKAKGGNQQSQPIPTADWLAIYVHWSPLALAKANEDNKELTLPA